MPHPLPPGPAPWVRMDAGTAPRRRNPVRHRRRLSPGTTRSDPGPMGLRFGDTAGDRPVASTFASFDPVSTPGRAIPDGMGHDGYSATGAGPSNYLLRKVPSP